MPARVPGSVVDDLWRAGDVADPYVGRNSLALEWIAERAWLYRRTFVVPALGGDERAWLRFDGVDHAARVFLDGRQVARHEGMFVPFEVPAGGDATGAEHELSVLVEPAPPSESQLGRTSRVRVHKSRMSYGWDFCPRLIHQGIWQSVTVVVRGAAWLADVWARPSLADDLSGGRVEVSVSVAGDGKSAASLEARLHDGERTIAVADAAVAGPAVLLTLDVDEPRLWWPNGLGAAAMYQLDVRLVDRDGAVLDTRHVPVGFRRVQLTGNRDAPAAARGYTLTVNGRAVPITGWNWVPLDVLHGVPHPGRLDHLVRLARSAGVNLLRVWGGGLIETRAFYDACDRAGILVWQEFSLSSSGTDSSPATDEAYVSMLRAEAEAIVFLRRNHPSLALWCGGNELEGPGGPLDEDHPVLAMLRDVTSRLDPDRAWLPTSPSGPRFHNRLDVIAVAPDDLHDVHGPWEHQGLRAQYELYDRGTSLLNSEFGVEGMAGRRQVEAIVPDDQRWPATRENPVYRHLGDWWINEPLVQSAFGGRLHDLATLARASRHLQADGLRYAVEATRRRWPRNSGTIPWQFNESYPNAWCTAAVDHRGDPKPAYFGVARAYRPLHVCAAFEGAALGGGDLRAVAWAWSMLTPLPDAVVRASIRGLDGTTLAVAEGRTDRLASAPVAVVEVERAMRPAAEPLVFVDLELLSQGRRVADNRYLFSTGDDFGPLLDVAPATVEVTRRAGPVADAWDLAIRHVAGPAAMGVTIEDGRPYAAAGWAEPSESGFDLLPGECRTVAVRWADAPVGERRLRVSAWNLESIDVA
jgi:beta-mannosidase